MHNNYSYYRDMLHQVREQIIPEIENLVKELGGKICVAFYHTECNIGRNAFFDIDDNGYGHEYFLDMIYTDEEGNLRFELSDTEDAYHDTWKLSYFNDSEVSYILSEIEDIANYCEENNEPIRTEYPDWAE